VSAPSLPLSGAPRLAHTPRACALRFARLCWGSSAHGALRCVTVRGAHHLERARPVPPPFPVVPRRRGQEWLSPQLLVDEAERARALTGPGLLRELQARQERSLAARSSAATSGGEAGGGAEEGDVASRVAAGAASGAEEPAASQEAGRMRAGAVIADTTAAQRAEVSRWRSLRVIVAEMRLVCDDTPGAVRTRAAGELGGAAGSLLAGSLVEVSRGFLLERGWPDAGDRALGHVGAPQVAALAAGPADEH